MGESVGDDDAIWQALIAGYDAPVDGVGRWPDRENLTDPHDGRAGPAEGQLGTAEGHVGPAEGQLGTAEGHARPGPATGEAYGPACGHPPGVGRHIARHGAPLPDGWDRMPDGWDQLPDGCDSLGNRKALGYGPGRSADTPAADGAVADDEEHYVPPPPPPLPKLDPVTKAAWAALFGGPAYLLIVTAGGWSMPAVAAFCAIAVFLGGFVVLVLRMGDGPRSGTGPDDGAVV